MRYMHISESQLQEILTAIEVSSNNRDWWTITAAVISAIAAVVAIVISIRTAKRQNSIALYEKRLECDRQLQALKNFMEFCKKQKTFHKDGRIDPIYQCQQAYLNAHYSVLDRDYLKNWKTLQDAYMSLALEKDREFFDSTIYLNLFDYASQSKSSYDALKKFIESLFSYVTADRPGGDPAANILAHAERLKEERDALDKIFTEFLREENSAKQKLRL